MVAVSAPRGGGEGGFQGGAGEVGAGLAVATAGDREERPAARGEGLGAVAQAGAEELEGELGGGYRAETETRRGGGGLAVVDAGAERGVGDGAFAAAEGGG